MLIAAHWPARARVLSRRDVREGEGVAREVVAHRAELREVSLELGPRFGVLAASRLREQVVTDGKQTFLADRKEGRVWRYFHHTREGGNLKEEEGFLPLPFFYGGKKYPTADLKSGE